MGAAAGGDAVAAAGGGGAVGAAAAGGGAGAGGGVCAGAGLAGAAAGAGAGMVALTAVLQAGDRLATLVCRQTSASLPPGVTPEHFDMKSDRQLERMALCCSAVTCAAAGLNKVAKAITAASGAKWRGQDVVMMSPNLPEDSLGEGGPACHLEIFGCKLPRWGCRMCRRGRILCPEESDKWRWTLAKSNG